MLLKKIKKILGIPNRLKATVLAIDELKKWAYKEGGAFADQQQSIEEIRHHIITITNNLTELNNQMCLLENQIIWQCVSLSNVNEGQQKYVNTELGLLSIQPQTNKKRVLVVGFYGAPNLGDELMLHTLLHYLILTDKYDVTVMLAENPEFDASVYQNVHILHYSRTVSDFSHLASFFDILILGGGCVIDDNGWLNINQGFLSLGRIVVELPRFFSAAGKAVYALGLSSIKELTDPLYIQRLNETVQGCKYFSLRDPYSLQTLKRAGVCTESIHLSDDLVWAHPMWRTYSSSRHDSDSIQIGITWFNVSDIREDLKLLLLSVLGLAEQSRLSININLLSFYDFHQADVNYFNDTIKELPLEAATKIKIIPYPQNVEGVLVTFSEQNIVINMRYHAALLCGIMGVPQVIGILPGHPHYDNKMRWVQEVFPSVLETFSVGASDMAESVFAFAQKNFQSSSELFMPERFEHNAEALRQLLEEL